MCDGSSSSSSDGVSFRSCVSELESFAQREKNVVIRVSRVLAIVEHAKKHKSTCSLYLQPTTIPSAFIQSCIPVCWLLLHFGGRGRGWGWRRNAAASLFWSTVDFASPRLLTKTSWTHAVRPSSHAALLALQGGCVVDIGCCLQSEGGARTAVTCRGKSVFIAELHCRRSIP